MDNLLHIDASSFVAITPSSCESIAFLIEQKLKKKNERSFVEKAEI